MHTAVVTRPLPYAVTLVVVIATAHASSCHEQLAGRRFFVSGFRQTAREKCAGRPAINVRKILMLRNRHRIQFPVLEANALGQNDAFFYLQEGEEKQRIRFHDYTEIYQREGLYEQLFYDRLKCQSPAKVASILNASVAQANTHMSELRVLDLGAGNGMMGDELKKYGCARLVGIDIIRAARDAANRDRPGVYDAYYVQDLSDMHETEREEIASWSLDCLTTVAALGFGDIPPKVFIEAFNLIQERGWVAFNIKETFLNKSDDSGFSRLMRELIFSEYLDLNYLERYRHRLSIEGKPLYYFAIAGRKNANISPQFLSQFGY
jgi:SAM-dependent methyltransferase